MSLRSVLCAVLVSACVPTLAACASGERPQASVSTTSATRPVSGAAGRNRSLALAAAAAAYVHFPVPSGSTRLGAAPRRGQGLRHLGADVGPIDTTLTRTGWWLVPLSYDRLVDWYANRTPADVRSTYPANSTAPAADAVFYWPTRYPSAAYSTPVDVVGYTRLGRQLTAIRTDVTLAARADRTAPTLVPVMVTSIDVTKRAIDGTDTTPKTASVTDPGRIRAVTKAFDNLLGDYASAQHVACASPVGIVYTYAVTFRWPQHTLGVDAGAPLCGEGRGLVRDGRTLSATLADDPRLDTALAAAFHS